MAEKTAVAILTGYFNSGEGYKRDNQTWIKELRELSPEEKAGLAQEVCAVTGDTVKAS